MKRVHDKLNILIVCTVVAIAAVGYLLIQTGTIDPTMASGSGITSIKKAEKYSKKNTVEVELEGEEMQEVLQNENFMSMIGSPEFAKLVENDEFLKVLDDPVFSIVADVLGNGELMSNEPLTSQGRDGGGLGKDLREGTVGGTGADFNPDRGAAGGGVRDGNTHISQSGGENFGPDNISNSGGKGPGKLLMKMGEFQKFMKGAKFEKNVR